MTRAPSPTDDARLTDAEIAAYERVCKAGYIADADEGVVVNIDRLLAALRSARTERDDLAAMNLQRVAAYEEIMRVNNRWQKRTEAAEAREQALRGALQAAGKEVAQAQRALQMFGNVHCGNTDRAAEIIIAALASRPPAQEE